MLVVYRNFLGESHPAAGERPEGVFGGRGERVDGARSESGAAREQAVVGEGVEGFSQYRRGVHDDRLQRVHRRGACLHRGIPRDLQLTAPSAVSHDALIDFPSEKACKASDDVPFRPSIAPCVG